MGGRYIIVRKKLITFGIAGTMLMGGLSISRLPYFVGETVTEIIDGDSFKINNKQTICLASLDAPEMGYCYSQEAKDALTKKFWVKRL